MRPFRTTLTQSTFGIGDLADRRGREYKLDVETALHVRAGERAFAYLLPRGVPPPHMGPDPEVIEFVIEDEVVATGTVTAQYARAKGERCRTGIVVVAWQWLGWVLTEEETLRPNAVARPV